MKNKPPKYVRIGSPTGTAMRLERRQHNYFASDSGYYYWRPAGEWGVDFEFNEVEQCWKTKLEADPDLSYLDNLPIIAITRKEFMKENEGYV
jgi:hypothetical protein